MGEDGFLNTCRNQYHRVAAAAYELLKIRFELFGLELREEKINIIRVLMMTVAALGFTFLAAITLTIAIVMTLPNSFRAIGLAVLAVIYFILAIVMVWRVSVRLRRRPSPFSQTLAEIKKDIECF
jgi:uncharacterized membrane protein YqjE